jgi:hypothetical protein
MKLVKATFVGSARPCALLAFILMAALADATGTNQLSKSDDALENFTLEQLVNVQVTSVSKEETDLFTAPAAIYVTTQEDIHRSGLQTIPELLRMEPGMDVARIDANHWAVHQAPLVPLPQEANPLICNIDFTIGSDPAVHPNCNKT